MECSFKKISILKTVAWTSMMDMRSCSRHKGCTRTSRPVWRGPSGAWIVSLLSCQLIKRECQKGFALSGLKCLLGKFTDNVSFFCKSLQTNDTSLSIDPNPHPLGFGNTPCMLSTNEKEHQSDRESLNGSPEKTPHNLEWKGDSFLTPDLKMLLGHDLALDVPITCISIPLPKGTANGYQILLEWRVMAM